MRDARNIVLLNIQHRAILYQHITIMNIQDCSFIITQFGTGKCVIRDSAIKHFIKLTLFPSSILLHPLSYHHQRISKQVLPFPLADVKPVRIVHG